MKKTIFFFALLTLIVSCNKPTPEATKSSDPVIQTTKPTQSALENLKEYPAAMEGMERYVIMLDSLDMDMEEEYKLELIPGKTMEVDCNKHALTGDIKENTVEGFGYSYYVFTSNGDMMSTLMACPDNTKTNKFISGPTVMTRYNSLLPVVVYAPKGFELKYKIWKANKLEDAKKK